MISYEPLWDTLVNKNITTYKLIKEYNISRGMLDNLKHNRNVTVETIGRLCEILDCKVEDIIEYRNVSNIPLDLEKNQNDKIKDINFKQQSNKHIYVAEDITKYGNKIDR